MKASLFVPRKVKTDDLLHSPDDLLMVEFFLASKQKNEGKTQQSSGLTQLNGSFSKAYIPSTQCDWPETQQLIHTFYYTQKREHGK